MVPGFLWNSWNHPRPEPAVSDLEEVGQGVVYPLWKTKITDAYDRIFGRWGYCFVHGASSSCGPG